MTLEKLFCYNRITSRAFRDRINVGPEVAFQGKSLKCRSKQASLVTTDESALKVVGFRGQEIEISFAKDFLYVKYRQIRASQVKKNISKSLYLIYIKGAKMGSRINWHSALTRDKVVAREENNTPGWRTIRSNSNVTCQACQRRIKINQKMLWHVETKAVMHIPQECKLW